MSKNSKILLALLAGAAAGSALALLFAPETGEKTRQRIMDAAQDLSDKIMERAEEIVDNAQSVVEKGRSYIKQQL